MIGKMNGNKTFNFCNFCIKAKTKHKKNEKIPQLLRFGHCTLIRLTLVCNTRITKKKKKKKHTQISLFYQFQFHRVETETRTDHGIRK